MICIFNIHFNKVKQTNIFRKWSPSGEYFEILGIVSGGFRYADDIYCFIAHSEVKTEMQNTFLVDFLLYIFLVITMDKNNNEK